jgi:hypothetical protein
MYLAEILIQKEMLNKKIKEIKYLLMKNQSDDMAQELMVLIESKQSKLMQINSANNQSSIRIGGTDVSIANAIIIRDTIKEKVDFLTSLIKAKDSSLDKLSLIEQRDKFFDEYTILNIAIQRNDLNVTIG